MDIKIKLEEERLFILYEHGKKMINLLNKKGIFTIEDFINCNANQLSYETYKKKQFKLFQELLKYKYLGIPLIFGNLLDKEYDTTDFGISKDLETLGFTGCNYWIEIASEILATKSSFTLVDFIVQLNDDDYYYLKDFYIKFYLAKVENEDENTNYIDINNNKQLLELLKEDLANLKEKREKIDETISLLEENISELEESLRVSQNQIIKKELKPVNN